MRDGSVTFRDRGLTPIYRVGSIAQAIEELKLEIAERDRLYKETQCTLAFQDHTVIRASVPTTREAYFAMQLWTLFNRSIHPFFPPHVTMLEQRWLFPPMNIPLEK